MGKEVKVNWLKPKNDFIFKLLFGSDQTQSEELLLAFLNDLFNVPEGQSLVAVEILNPMTTKMSETDKLAIFDVKGRVTGYGFVNIEMQVMNQKNMDKRSLYYAAKLYEEQLAEGEDYRKLTKVAAINLIDFNYFPGPNYRHFYKLLERDTYEAFPELLQLYFIEMPKFVKLKQQGKLNENDRMEKWLTFLTNTDDTRWMEMAKQDPIIEKAVSILKKASLDPKVRMEYKAREKALKDMASIRGDGIEEGLAVGKKEGKKVKALEIAEKMLAKGMDEDVISEMTGLSISEIAQLKEEVSR